MTVLPLLVLLWLLFVLLAGSFLLIWTLYQQNQRLQAALNDTATTYARSLMDQAAHLAERTPEELTKLLTYTQQQQDSMAKNLISLVSTAWNPSPTPESNANPLTYHSPFPVIEGRDEAQNRPAVDPTDLLLPPLAEYRPDGIVVDAAAPGAAHNPFGIEGLEFVDPLAHLSKS